MSTIYQINTGEKVLVLESKEALIYPFNFGSWGEIRVGAYMSLTTNDSFTGFYTGVKLEISTALDGLLYNRFDNFYWGITKSGNPFPFQTGSYFIGSSLNSGQGLVEYRISSSPTSAYLDILDQYTVTLQTNTLAITSGGQLLNNQTYTGERASLYFPDGESATGNNSLSMFNGLRFLYNSGTNDISVSSFGDKSSSIPSISNLSNLETKINLFQNPSSSPVNEYCDIQNLPSAMFLFSPFTGYRLRVHSFLIKKYS